MKKSQCRPECEEDCNLLLLGVYSMISPLPGRGFPCYTTGSQRAAISGESWVFFTGGGGNLKQYCPLLDNKKNKALFKERSQSLKPWTELFSPYINSLFLIHELHVIININFYWLMGGAPKQQPFGLINARVWDQQQHGQPLRASRDALRQNPADQIKIIIW